MQQEKNYSSSIALGAKDFKAISYRQEKLKAIEIKALDIMQKLKADSQWLQFYCKCIHELSEHQVAYILEGAQTARNPDRYFASAAKAEMLKNKV